MKITKIQKKDGTSVYRSQIYLGTDVITGKKVKTSVTGKTKTEVKRLAKQRQDDFIKNGCTVFKTVKANTFKELLTLWLETYKPTVKRQTYLQMLCIIDNHVLPYLGGIKLSKLTTPLLQNYVNQLVNGTYKQYQAVFSIVKRSLAYGVSLQLLPANPMLNVIVPKVRKEEHTQQQAKHLDSKQLKQFLDYLDNLAPSYKNQYDTTLYKLLLSTGLRIGEALALTWSDIDLDKGTLTVNKTYNVRTHSVSTPKTKSSYRTISIDNKTVLMLRLYHNRQAQYFKELGADCDVVFSTGRLAHPFPHTMQTHLSAHFKKAGLPRFTFHAFRHTHASLLLNAGITYKELQHRLGHSKISMTLDTYSHLSKDKEKEAVSFYEKALNSL